MGPAQPFIWGPRSELLAWNVIFFNKSSESKLQWSSHKGLLKNGHLDGELRACALWLWLLFSTQGLKEEPPASCPAVHWGLMQDYWLRPSKWHSVREPGPSWEDKSQGLVAVREAAICIDKEKPQSLLLVLRLGLTAGLGSEGVAQWGFTNVSHLCHLSVRPSDAATANTSSHFMSTYFVPGTGPLY